MFVHITKRNLQYTGFRRLFVSVGLYGQHIAKGKVKRRIYSLCVLLVLLQQQKLVIYEKRATHFHRGKSQCCLQFDLGSNLLTDVNVNHSMVLMILL